MVSLVLKLMALAGPVAAFPRMMDALTDPLQTNAYNKLMPRQGTDPPQGAGALPLTPPPFDAELQYVSNQGQYAFVAPGPDDARGECPGLNAMANHGYLPHNGVATIAEFINATNYVFGMALDLGGFLSIFGALVDGDGASWSIEGGPHVGIGGSHNNYETDSSPMKADLYQYGTNQRLILTQFHELYDAQPDADTANYNLEALRTFRATRFQESIDMNPYFFYNPFGGIEVSQAAFTFIYRFMANKSAEYPEGVLNKEVLKSFMSISGPEDDLVWTQGHEAIPDNWYTRHPSDQYSIVYFQTDILYFAETVPQILTVGCNQGVVNSYLEITPESLTYDAYTTEEALANPICFASEFALAELPLLTGLNLTVLTDLVTELTNYIDPLNCPGMTSVNQSALALCPGLSLYGGPTAAVAPGAIQYSS